MDLPLARAVLKLAWLLDAPEDGDYLVRLAMREIVYRLLCTNKAERVRQIAAHAGGSSRVARAIQWVRDHFDKPLSCGAAGAAIRSRRSGASGNRYGRKPTLVRASIGMAVTMSLMGLSTDIWQLVGLRLLAGIAGADRRGRGGAGLAGPGRDARGSR